MLSRLHTSTSLCYHTSLNHIGKFDKNYARSAILQYLNRSYSDVVIIGGGAMGASTAFWLKEKSKNINITVVEKDPTYTTCSTSLSVGGIRQQFALPENIKMSLFGADFIKNIRKKFGPEADISYMPCGYLLLASDKGAKQLEENFRLQKELGATNELLTKEQLKKRFVWLNVEDVELGSLGCEKEGWFDPWGLLSLFKNQAINKGVNFIQGEVVNFIFENNTPTGVKVKLPGKNQTILSFDQCVLAAGAESGKIAKLAKIGDGDGKLSYPLPVERRFESQGRNCPEFKSPLTIDYTGTYFRNDGTGYIGGLAPQPEDEPAAEDLEVDFGYFDSCVWPNLAHRIPAFESIKVKSAWAGYYEYNTVDKNGIIGAHPVYKNFYFVTGFSGHGIQQSPAAGLAIAELILDGKFKTIDLTRMGFDRFITNKPVYETEIY